MRDDAWAQPSDEQILQFVHYLKQLLAKVTNPTPEELVHLQGLLQGAQAKEKLDPAAFHLMGNILYAKKNPTMGELSHALSVPLSTATRMANWWVDNGFARRLSDPDDRRIVRLELTDSGERLLEALESHIAETVKAVLSCLTSDERTTLVTLFGKVASSTETEGS